MHRKNATRRRELFALWCAYLVHIRAGTTYHIFNRDSGSIAQKIRPSIRSGNKGDTFSLRRGVSLPTLGQRAPNSKLAPSA
ncbi:hypothetical protein EDB87DRAFT_1157206 [Lactarius vividus]|nr:hypothetical protein EDB87DRAFT_1157206 [Lactarius vividus]